MKLDLTPVKKILANTKEFFAKHFAPDKIKEFALKHKKWLMIAGGAVAVVIIAAIVIAAIPKPVEAHTFRAAQDEYLVMMMLSSDWGELDSSHTATLIHQKSGETLTANFLEGKRSFCFYTPETGVYDFSYRAQDGTEVTRRISVDESNNLYFVVIFPDSQ